MSTTILSVISLIVLFAVIAFGFIKKINIGVLSFGIAMVLGMATGMNQKDIIGGFNTSLFVILLGSMFLFAIAQLNGTIDLMAKKTVVLAGKQGWAVPIFMYLLGFIVAVLGPGTIPGFGIVAMFGVPLAFAMRADPFLLCCIGQMGAIGGGIVPWAPTGVVGISKAAEAGYTEGIATPLFINVVIASIFVSITLYILYRGWRVNGDTGLKRSEISKFNKNQILTLMGILTMVICVIVFRTNIGLTSFLGESSFWLTVLQPL
ncbi:SLC13 family permease [Eubacterium sp.]|uniref:SLC13 family permease n=1 Tax=Eubacterium sp. TaxID=142586 RepID=UPI002FC5B583